MSRPWQENKRKSIWAVMSKCGGSIHPLSPCFHRILFCVMILCFAPVLSGCSEDSVLSAKENSKVNSERIERIKVKRDEVVRSSEQRIEQEGGIESARGKALLVLNGKRVCLLDYEKILSLPQSDFEKKREDVAAATIFDLLKSEGLDYADTVVFSNFVEPNLLSVSWKDVENRKDAFVFVATPRNVTRLRYKEMQADAATMKMLRVKKIDVRIK